MDLKDKIVVITGAASGIGKACAIQFALAGSMVILTDIDTANMEETADSIQGISGKVASMKLDVTDFEEVSSVLEKIVATYGRIDVMINNAGVMNLVRTDTANHSLDDWHRVISINQTGVFYCMKAVLGKMMTQRAGVVVNMASLAGLKGSGYNLAYSASKFAVVGMTKSAAMEYASHNIRINAVCPSYTQTPMLEAVVERQPGIDKKLLRFVPMGRFAEADEIAEAVLWLASEKSKFITGQALTIDGGLSL